MKKQILLCAVMSFFVSPAVMGRDYNPSRTVSSANYAETAKAGLGQMSMENTPVESHECELMKSLKKGRSLKVVPAQKIRNNSSADTAI